jgi:hypothetical protein
MLTKEQVQILAAEWVADWNSHDLERIMSHYHPDVVLISPVAAQLLSDSSGTVVGKDALRAYFHKGLAAYPHLEFELLDVMWGISSVVIYYANQRGTRTGEFMEIDATGQVTKVIANYNA